MIKYLHVLALLCLISAQAAAQDIITKKTGEGIKAKVVEITPTEVKFKRFENLDGPMYTLAKTDLLMVKYENNTEEIFTGNDSYTRPANNMVATTSTSPDIVNVPATPVTSAPIVTTTGLATGQDMYIKGQLDAELHYDNYKGAGTGVLLTSLLVSPLIGLVPAVVCSTTKPQDHNLDYPNFNLMQDPSYKKGYTNKARKIKSGRVWRNWGIAFGINAALIIALSQ